jgi:hypothetical protein
MNKSYQSQKAYLGDVSQLFDVREYRMLGGKAEGTRAVEVWNGDKLTVTILPDRGMDIYSVRYNNSEMSWHSMTGIVHPSYYNDFKSRWFRSFQGGFLATCGLDWIGGADEDFRPNEGLHGRHNHTPADRVSVRTDFDENGEPYCEISGEVIHARLFGTRYRLRRTFVFRRCENSFTFRDEIVNEGFARQPLYLLYHFNLGYPLISESCELLIDATRTYPQDEYSAGFEKVWRETTPPVPGYRQNNFYHDLPADSEGFRHYGVRNADIDTTMKVSFRSPIMDKIFQWRNFASGDYIMGLEPTSMLMVGRRAEEAGELKFTEPGQTVTNDFRFDFTPAG